MGRYLYLRAALLILLSGLSVPVFAQATSCTGLCLQQVSCPGGGTTSITGTIYAPNGVDPLPNVIVYVPNAAVDAFTPGVSCPVVGAAPSGSPLIGTTTAANGTFTLNNVPVGSNIPLVMVTGRWRRQVTIATTTACTNTPIDASLTHMPTNQSEGDIPKIAVATGSVDQVECVLRKVGIQDSEFTDPSGTGRINFFLGTGAPGSEIDASTPSAHTLMGASATLNSYDVLMLPCEGNAYPSAPQKTATELSNLVQFANAGGRVYSSHFSYGWMYQNPPFNTVVNWIGSSTTLPDGPATVDTTFADGQTLSTWLQLVGASTTPGQIAIATVKHDFNGVNSPTQSWLRLDSSGNPVMQFVFDTPVGATASQCGKVLFNEYHVEGGTSSPTKVFPTECSNAAMTPQEKLLEYSLFELTSDGSAATLTPTTQDFGTVAVGFSDTETFTWTNNSTFPAAVSSITGSGDFSVGSNPCTSVQPGASCQIVASFTPTVVGARTGTLTVTSSASTLTSALTGTGVADVTFAVPTLNFGNVDVGSYATQPLTITNNASGPLAIPPFLITGDYSVTAPCSSPLAAGASCNLNVTFRPTTTGARPGMLTVNSSSSAYSGVSTALTGNGVDFTLTLSPGSGTTIAGDGAATVATLTPLGGYSSPITMTCTTQAVASTCTMASPITVSAPMTVQISISTTSKYTVVGYGGAGGSAWLALLALGTGWLLWMKRRSASVLARAGLLALLLGCIGVWTTGCSGKLPDLNSSYTLPGSYTYTITGSDGTLVHSATYTLNVTSN